MIWVDEDRFTIDPEEPFRGVGPAVVRPDASEVRKAGDLDRRLYLDSRRLLLGGCRNLGFASGGIGATNEADLHIRGHRMTVDAGPLHSVRGNGFD